MRIGKKWAGNETPTSGSQSVPLGNVKIGTKANGLSYSVTTLHMFSDRIPAFSALCNGISSLERSSSNFTECIHNFVSGFFWV